MSARLRPLWARALLLNSFSLADQMMMMMMMMMMIIIVIIIIITAIVLSPGGSDYFTCIQNMKLVTTKF